MEIFRHRPLFLWCTAFTAAAAGGYILCDVQGRFPVSLRAVFLCLVGVVLSVGIGLTLYFGLRRQRYTAVVAAITSVSILLGLLQSAATFTGKQASALQDLTDTEVTVTATVLERRGEGGYLSSFALELDEINEHPVKGMAVLTCHYLAELSPGDVLTLAATAVSLEGSAGDSYSAEALRGDGYVVGLLSESEEDIEITGHTDTHLRVRMSAVRRTLAARLNLLCGRGAAGLPSAFLLGDKSALSDEVRRDFARAGVSHLLAISGLHMTLLFGLLDGLLRLLRVSKRWRAILLGIAATAYLVLLGFPPSATRAVVMLGLVYLSTLLSVRADALTSLGVAGALILICTPYAAADAGFWMSYMATFGLLAVMPWINACIAAKRASPHSNAWIERGKALLYRLGCGLAVGVIAMSCTLSLTAAVIGEMGIFSPIATLILSPLCGCVLLLSLLALPLAHTAFGSLLGRSIAALSTAMADIAAGLGEPRGAVVSLVHPAVLPLSLLMMAGLLLLLGIRLSERRRWLLLLPLLVGWTAIGGVLTVSDALDGSEPTVSFLQPSSESDMLVLTEGHDAVICDLSNGSLSALTAACTEASRCGATEIAALMLTHYHRRTIGTLGDILARETVREVWVPLPTSPEECDFLMAYAEKAEDAGVPVVLYEPGARLRVFGTCELTLHTEALSRSEQPLLLLTLDMDTRPDHGGELVYVGSAVFESSLLETAIKAVAHSEQIIFGNHGPIPKQPFGMETVYRDHVSVILSEKGAIAAYFCADSLPENAELWLGQWRSE